MPLWLAALLGGLVEIAGTLVGKVLLSLGFGYVTYSGVDTGLTWAKTFALAKIGAAGGQVVAFAGVLQVGTCISMVAAAISARLLISGLTGGSFKRLVMK